MHMVKMIDPPVQYDRPGSHLEFLKLGFSMHMVKRWLTPQVWQTMISPRIFKVKIQHAHCQKMIDTPPRYDRPGAWTLQANDHGGDCYMKDLLPGRVLLLGSQTLLLKQVDGLGRVLGKGISMHLDRSGSWPNC